MDHKEVRRQVSDTVEFETDDEIKQAWHRFGVILVVACGLMITAIVVVILQRGIVGAGESDQPEKLPPLTLLQIQEQISETAQAYLEADSVPSKLRHVFNARQANLRMPAYYDRRPIETQRFRELVQVLPRPFGDRQLYIGTIRYDDGATADWDFELEERQTKIHWEPMVAYATADWDTFVASRESQPTTFRVLLAGSQEAPDTDQFSAEDYLCFLVRVPYSGKQLHAFLAKSSETHLAKEGSWNLAPGLEKKVIGSLRFPLNATDAHVIIDAIEHFSWLEGVDRWDD